ncbi:MAG: response regulator transcription factor [Limnochordales bacterium]|nr:response regulator transcription factor [Limnochordales bacterium]
MTEKDVNAAGGDQLAAREEVPGRRPAERGRVLVVDDEPNVVELVRLYLTREGFLVLEASDGEQALAMARATPPPDLMILDLMLPGLDGWEVCRRVRSFSSLPIIMLTARGEDIDRIVGLELGADDYLAKPFHPRELVARVKAVLRRVQSGAGQGWAAVAGGGEGGTAQREDARGIASVAAPGAAGATTATGPAELSTLKYPGLVIDRLAREVWVEGERVNLTPKEFDLLWQLASSPGRTFTREELLELVWGYDFFGSDRTVDVHIKRLREKLERHHDAPRYLQTVWGIGYKFDPLAGQGRG